MAAKKADLSEELVLLVKDMMKQQAEVLKVAMETQKSQAEVLNKWIGMFTPQAQPYKSTTEDERVKLREEMDASQWEPVTAPMFPDTDGDLFNGI